MQQRKYRKNNGKTMRTEYYIRNINTMNAKIKYYALSLLFTVLSITQLWAYDFSAVSPSGHRLYYTITSNTAPRTVEVVSPTGNGYSGYTEPTGNVVVPETVTYMGNIYRVTELGDGAFIGCRDILTLSLPSSLKRIGESACYDNYALTSIVIPDSVTYIGSAAFQYNLAMTYVVLPAQLQTIQSHAFHGCSNLSSISTIPASVTSIGKEAFHNNAFYNNSSNWTGDALYKDNCLLAVKTTVTGTVTIAPNTRIIAGAALKQCGNITSVSIPNSVISIGNNAFEKCFSLTSITIPHSVSYVGQTAFKECTGLNTVIWNTPNANINHSNSDFKPFDQCPQITNFIFGDSVRVIPGYALYNFASIQTLSIGNNVDSIGNYAFYNCNSLTSVDLSNVETIGNSAFYNCSGLTSVDLSNVETIGNSAFYNCSGLISVDLSNVETIGYNAFSYCSGLTSIDLSNVETIGNYAFRGCSSLTSIDFPESVSAIGNNAFENCDKLLSVEIPSSINNIGGNAFKNCDSLTTILWNANISSSNNNIFSECSNVQTLTIGDSTRVVPNSFMDGCSSLRIVSFGANVDTIGNNAFKNCDNLLSVEIPHYIKHVGTNAFYSCDSLKTVVWNTPYAELNHDIYNNKPFEACDSLTTFIFGDSIRIIPFRAIGGGSLPRAPINVRKVVIGKNIDTIYNETFNVCSNLDTIVSYAQIPPIIPNPSSAWGNTPTETLILVPCGSGNAYRSSSGWNRFTNINSVVLNNEINLDLNVNNVNYGNVHYNCDNQRLYATANYGYHFVQWSDGNTNNPRTIVNINNVSLQAIFAKNVYNISFSDTTMGVFTGGGQFEYLDTITISVAPKYGYTFASWMDGNTNTTRQVVVRENKQYVANFNPIIYNITVVSNNTAMGTANGGGSYPYNTNCTITATPASDQYCLLQWSDGNTDNPRTVTVLGDATYEAIFGPKPTYTLAVQTNNSEWGTVSGSGSYLHGTVVSITATANNGYHFTSWSDGSTQSSRSIQVIKDSTITAIFERNTYSVSGAVNVQDRGSISGVGNYLYLDSVYVTANANYGYHFTQWSDGNTDNPRILQITGNTTVTAVFDKNIYTLTATANYSDRGFVRGSGTYEYQRMATVEAIANIGYHFTQWSDGSIQMTRSIQIVKDSTITAIFEPNKYTITATVNSSSSGMGSASGGGTFDYKTMATLTASANYGYHFTRWNDNNTDSIRTVEVLGNANYYANFAPNRYTLNLSVADEAMGTVTGYGTYDYLTEVQIRANSKQGYFFSQWSDGNKDNPRTITLKRDTAFTAYFTDTYVGVEEAEELANLAFYPNPTEGTITFNNQEIKKVEVLDAMGRVVAVHENSYIIDLSKLNKGLYTLRITLPQGVTIRKVIRK